MLYDFGALLRGVFMLIALILHDKAFTMPPAATKKEREAAGGKGYIMVNRWIWYIAGIWIDFHFVMEVCVCLLSGLSGAPISRINSFKLSRADICPPEASLYPPMLSFSPPFLNPQALPIIVPLALMYLGAFIRIPAQGNLASLFKWETSIQQDHKLITSGPYAYVRHPAYTGGSLLVLGHTLFLYSSHTLMSECLSRSKVVAYMRGAVVIGRSLLPIYSAFWRAAEEDRLLKKEFGKEWDQWAARTKYRLIPYVY